MVNWQPFYMPTRLIVIILSIVLLFYSIFPHFSDIFNILSLNVFYLVSLVITIISLFIIPIASYRERLHSLMIGATLLLIALVLRLAGASMAPSIPREGMTALLVALVAAQYMMIKRGYNVRGN